ncbi:hypothetical protein WJ0W_006748 [Paenibacillus melissococcoides]|uniref:Uncharacterized protein n=1 Tax=Paenibacillus melissococcoides TaxID=2912268 RepID=A0ABN8UGS5_9BACL|nr:MULTISPECIES: hypothetical protein [Paenibacillus]MEB9897603.1 hypothetical protein [Bacillus cereus]CAH8249563.1 hypothetical protein WJ0W_006748 [Paenibacillus melissococcoides]CAH8721068.1 hypothetical protein HTL2_006171 [Paenibacillus melissococcoides]
MKRECDLCGKPATHTFPYDDPCAADFCVDCEKTVNGAVLIEDEDEKLSRSRRGRIGDPPLRVNEWISIPDRIVIPELKLSLCQIPNNKQDI